MDEKLRELLEKQEIIDAIHRIARGTDRADFALFKSGYHDGAIDDHGLFSGPVEDLLPFFKDANKTFICTQHVVTNIHIELLGDKANTETYFNAFHRRRDQDGKLWDDWLKGRYLDRFEKRKGVWRTANRLCAWDWTHTQPASTTPWADVVGGNFIMGKRDSSDPYYSLFKSTTPP